MSRYVRNSLTWVSLYHLCHNRAHPWTDTDQWAIEDCSEDADYYRGEILRLPDELFVKVVAILCTYAAHLTDVLDTHTHEDPSLTMPAMGTLNSITSPNHFHVLSTLIGNPEPSRNTLTRLLDTAMGQVDALGRLAERVPNNPIDAALYDLDVAYGVSG